MAYGYSLSAPPVQLQPPAIFQIDPTLDRGDNDWAELSRTNPNAFLGHLLTALAAPNPVSSAGPTVEEAFKSHLVSLAPNPQQMQPIPSLYSILKTFWLPSSPAYFSLTASASTARTPSEHRFLYWDPQPLVFNGIACPSCSTVLVNKGRISSGPVKIYDIERPFFIVGCEYVCRSPACVAATSAEGRKFASTDPSILRSLPVRLKDEFPARLLYGEGDVGSGAAVWCWKAMGVSTGLWNLVTGGLSRGLRKEVVLSLIWAVQHGVPEVQGDPGQVPQLQVQNGSHAPEDDKMEEEEDAEEEEGDDDDDGQQEGVQESQTLSSTVSNLVRVFWLDLTLLFQNFSDAYGDAWKENTATGTPDSPQKQTPAPTPAPAPAPTPQPQAGPSSQPQIIQPQMVQPTGYNPYTAYPFTPYAYMPHHMVNGQMVPLNIAQMGHPPQPQPSTALPNGLNAPEGTVASASGSGTGTSKRSPRHCCKCGSQDCKGKGGRSFCTNRCQDCGKLECKGRNSRRPDKKCSEGWQ